MTSILAGTVDGLTAVRGEIPALDGEVRHVAGWRGGLVAVVDGKSLMGWTVGPWEHLVDLPQESHCVLAREEELFVGTSEARLVRVTGGDATFVDGFDDAPGRAGWFTPWGGPPDVRSLALGGDGAIYANVHVGGILKSSDAKSWEPTGLDIDSDVHQVIAHAGGLLAACAWGLARSSDGGRNWAFTDEGLHGSYCRSVAATAEGIFVSASEGPHAGKAAVYQLVDGRFEKLTGGLPQWFEGNIDTHCLAAIGDTVACGTEQGEVFVSEDGGGTFEKLGEVGRIDCVFLGQK